MPNEDVVNLRDFIYLDVERVKSLLAQVDRGLLNDWTNSTGTSDSVEGKAGISIPAVFEVGGAGNYVATNQSTETLTLHDFVYNQTEERLRDIGRITVLSEDSPDLDMQSSDIRSYLSSVEYVLLKGSVEIHDYEYMRNMLENINDFKRIFTEMKYQSELDSVVGKDKNQLRQKIKGKVDAEKLDPAYVKNLVRVLDFFPRDRLSIKVTPFSTDPSLRAVGPLQKTFLRERLEDIRFKYGASPKAKWTVFGQVAAVPDRHELRDLRKLSFSSELEGAFQGVFDAMLEVDDQFRIRYPEIAITPIAVYRD